MDQKRKNPFKNEKIFQKKCNFEKNKNFIKNCGKNINFSSF